MKRMTMVAVIASLLALGIWHCGSDDTSTGPNPTTAEYAVWGMVVTFQGESMEKRAVTPVSAQDGAMVWVTIQKDNGTEDGSTWPYQRATEVKLIGPREIPLMEGAFGNMISYTLPEQERVASGEEYKLRVTVGGKTFTSQRTAKVLDPLTVTLSREWLEPGASLTVQWNSVSGAAGYVVEVMSFDEALDTTFAVGNATQKVLSGELFQEEDEYDITVSAYDATMAPYANQPGMWQGGTLEGSGMPSVFGFDDSSILGTFFAIASDDVSIQVGSGGGNGGGNGGGGAIDITVSAGLAPTISWTGQKAQILSVMMGGDTGTAMWTLMATNPSSGFGSPVTYGQVPPGAVQLVTAKTLVAGTTYQVFITGVDMATMGIQDFTP